MGMFPKNKTKTGRDTVIKLRFFRLISVAGVALLIGQIGAQAQCLSSRQLYYEVIRLENDASLEISEKRPRALLLQKRFDSCGAYKDSAYARLLHRLGVWEFSVAPNDAISHTLASVRLNTSRRQEANPRLAVNSYYNLGYYFRVLQRYADALAYFDSCIVAGSRFQDSGTLVHVINARNQKAYICYQTGDYQQTIAEAALGLKTAAAINNAPLTIGLLNEQAQAYAAMGQISDAGNAADKALALIGKRDEAALANNYKIRAAANETAGNFAAAMAHHAQVIRLHKKAGDTAALALDYIDAGNTLREEAIATNSSSYSKVANCYIRSLALARKAGITDGVIGALNNLAAIRFRERNYKDALTTYHSGLSLIVGAFSHSNSLSNPTYRQCNPVSNKNTLSILLANKAECLLHLYKQSYQKTYLTAALRTALLTDSLITAMRHEQKDEQSKLYWRSETREFFTNAIEACYQANDAGLAFYFMEKSRSVLLYEKLNETGSAARLPAEAAAEEQRLQIAVFAQQQTIANLDNTDPAYEDAQTKLFAAREALDRYIRGLQAAHPVYYQYKYADDVPAPHDLKKYIAANGQSFVHYFISDTAVYMLAITPTSSLLLKQRGAGFQAQLAGFLKTCSDIQGLNNRYHSFAAQAYRLYKTLVEPLRLPKGRIVICHDAIAIPFEALTTNSEGTDFLIYSYSFSYVYSARALLKKFDHPPGRGQFLGVAPGRYAVYLGVQPLSRSGAALGEAATYYSHASLIKNKQANCRNFLAQLPHYTIGAIFSHARADSTDKEPLLFMADSVIRLSQLQGIRNPSTELIVLSACQTNAGRMATGEGIFSLARGFAAAGIPAIAATCWKADEEATYSITKSFLRHIANGMRKDDALQQAKLRYMQSGATRNSLPYYWANMVLAGNAEPVTLAADGSKAWWIAGAVLVFILIAFIRRKRRQKSGALISRNK